MILKAEILSHLNKELNRTETDIDEYILSAMKKLSLTDDFYWVESTFNMIAGRTYYSMPVDYKKLMTINLTGERPLKKLSWIDYRKLVATREEESDRDKPRCFAIHGNFWYPLPIPDDDYEATIHYNAFVPESETIDEEEVNAVDNIDRYFSDIFRDALNTLTKAYYCMSKELADKAAVYLQIFEGVDLPPLKKMVEREARSLPYRDLY